MISTMEFGKNEVINNVIKNYASKARQQNLDFVHRTISPPNLTISDNDLTDLLSYVLSAVIIPTSRGVSLNINEFSGKIKIECKSFQPKGESFNLKASEDILSRNDGMIMVKYVDDEFVVQIVFPV